MKIETRQSPWAFLASDPSHDVTNINGPRSTTRATMIVSSRQAMRVGWLLFWASFWAWLHRHPRMEFWMEDEG